MQLSRHMRQAAETTTRYSLVLFLLLALAVLMTGCGRLQRLSAASDPHSGACDQGLLAVGAWKCLSGGLLTANLTADRAAGLPGNAAAETVRP